MESETGNFLKTFTFYFLHSEIQNWVSLKYIPVFADWIKESTRWGTCNFLNVKQKSARWSPDLESSSFNSCCKSEYSLEIATFLESWAGITMPSSFAPFLSCLGCCRRGCFSAAVHSALRIAIVQHHSIQIHSSSMGNRLNPKQLSKPSLENTYTNIELYITLFRHSLKLKLPLFQKKCALHGKKKILSQPLPGNYFQAT